MKFRDFLLAEEKNDTAVMTFGRFQPITSAHETLIKQVGSLAKEKGAHPFVFTSRKSGDKKNPLDFNTKSDMLRKHYGVNVPDSEEITNPFQAAQHLGKLGYKNVHLVLGGDRVKDIGGMIQKYMGHEDPEKRINISNLTLHSAGERDANPVSGTAVRAAARSGNVKEFQRMIAPSLGKESTETIYRVLRGEQQLGESLDKPFPTTYRVKEKPEGGKRHYFDFELPPKDPKSKLPELSKPTKGKVEFNERSAAAGKEAKRGHYELSFDVGGETKTTGKGGAGGVLSTLKSSVKKFMKMNPDAKSFRAIIVDNDQYKKDSDGNVVRDKDGKPVFSGRAKLYKRLANYFGNKYGFDVEVDMKQGRFRVTRKKDPKLTEGIRQAFSSEDPDERDRRKQTEQEKQDFEDFKKKQNPDKIEGESLRDLLRKAGVKKPVSKRTGLGSTKLVGVKDPKTGKIVIKQVFANESLGEEANPRIPRKKGQPAKSKKHSDLYTDEDPKGTIHGLGFKNASVARASVKKIESSGRSHAHKIQAAVAMEQRARVANKDAAAAIYRRYIDRNKKSD